MSERKDFERYLGLDPRSMIWGPIRWGPDPGPPMRWWEEFTKVQRRVLIKKEIDIMIKTVQSRINIMNDELDIMKGNLANLNTMKSMMKKRM